MFYPQTSFVDWSLVSVVKRPWLLVALRERDLHAVVVECVSRVAPARPEDVLVRSDPDGAGHVAGQADAPLVLNQEVVLGGADSGLIGITVKDGSLLLLQMWLPLVLQ